MNTTLTQCLSALRAQRDQLNTAIASIEAIIPGGAASVHEPPAFAAAPLRRGKPATAKPRRGQGRPRQAPETAAPKSRRGRATGGLSGVMRAVVATLAEPFDARDVTAAIIAAQPDMRKHCEDGRVRGNLQYWSHKGDLVVVAPGAPGRLTKFKRGAKYSGASDRERAYQEFRSTIKTSPEAE